MFEMIFARKQNSWGLKPSLHPASNDYDWNIRSFLRHSLDVGGLTRYRKICFFLKVVKGEHFQTSINAPVEVLILWG